MFAPEATIRKSRSRGGFSASTMLIESYHLQAEYKILCADIITSQRKRNKNRSAYNSTKSYMRKRKETDSYNSLFSEDGSEEKKAFEKLEEAMKVHLKA
jgi:hypothetical protein